MEPLAGARGACGASAMREAGEAGGGMRALPPAVPAHALREGRHHRGHTAAVLAAAGERLDSLGGQASRGDSSRFSGISARKGGISTAIEARVDETILYLQSGHGAALPARAYMQIASPAHSLETF
jgi:hypothetical protein